jgi:hypothetical protein
VIDPHSDPAGGAADDIVMSYAFRMCLTNNASNALPLTPPPHYSRSAMELLRRELRAVSAPPLSLTLTMASLFLIRNLPHGKIDLNSGQFSANSGHTGHFPFSTDLPFAQRQWPAGAAAERASVFAAHKWWTQALLFYLGNDSELQALQPGLVAEMKSWGLCADEYTDQPDRWTPQLYVREANRLRGARVVTQHDICSPKPDDTAVGLSFWQIDIHAVQRVAQFNATDGEWRAYNIGGVDGFKSPIPGCHYSDLQV